MTQPPRELRTVEDANAAGIGRLPGLIGLIITEAGEGRVRSRLDIRPDHLAPNGYLHAATVIALADTACGYGALRSRPEGSLGFTTIEVKTNFLGTARDGAIACDAHLVHGGRMTQVWDAEVVDEATGKPIALFRCTQMILWPRE
ncbi:MAG: PaaI family thioesterase [Gemmatimonadales bacterium]